MHKLTNLFAIAVSGALAMACQGSLSDPGLSAGDELGADDVGSIAAELSACEQSCEDTYQDCFMSCGPDDPDVNPPCGDICYADKLACLDACEELDDDDGDGVINGSDNCRNTPNANQANCDGDAAGNACDDFNGTIRTIGSSRTLHTHYISLNNFCGYTNSPISGPFKQYDRRIETHKITTTKLRDYCDGTPDQQFQTIGYTDVTCDEEDPFSQSCSSAGARQAYPNGNPHNMCILP